MASIKDIARICGVSVATVSKALNDKKDISEETKRHIKEVAKENGYFPQYYARAIRMNRSFNLGVLFVDESMSGLTHDYFANILNSFKVTAEERGYDITFISSNKNSQQRKTYLEHCRYRGLDGVVIACIDFTNPEVKELVESGIPLVSIDFEFDSHASVLSDNEAGMTDLIEYIISKGHRRIAYITGEETSVVTEIREKVFRSVMASHNLVIPESFLMHSMYRDLHRASKFTEDLLLLEERPTCIIYSDDYSAVGGINQIKSMGYRIPEDISVAGYDDIFIAGQLQPRLTTVHQDTEQIGRKAAEKLISMIEKKNVPVRPVVVKTRLEEGESVGEV